MTYIPTYTAPENLPAPVTSGTTVQSFTDVYGEVWVALNGVAGGAWKKARDVLHCRYWRSTSWTWAASPADMVWDTKAYDDYGIYVSPSVVCPIAGVWRVELALTGQPVVSTQWISALINRTSDNYQLAFSGGLTQTVNTWQTARSIYTSRVPAGFACRLLNQSSVAGVAGIAGEAFTAFTVDYLGTG